MVDRLRRRLQHEVGELFEPGPPRARHHAESPDGVAATGRPEASDVAVDVLAAGGNAFDAAIAAAYALGVCEPFASGLGGQTAVIAHDARTGRTIVLDGSSRAPHRVEPGGLTDEQRMYGYRACTIPSTPATLDYLRRQLGTMPLDRLLDPAIRLAEEGCTVTRLQESITRTAHPWLSTRSARRFFLDDDGEVPEAGSVLRQPELASTFRRLAEAGVEDFYRGRIARAIVDDMREHGGLLHEDDLAQIPWPLERRAYTTSFRGRDVHTFGPPGAGRVLISILNVLERVEQRGRDPRTPEGALLLARLGRRTQLDRRRDPYDPDFYPQLGGERMLSPEYADELVAELLAHDPDDVRFEDVAPDAPGRGETTHLSVMDREGNAIALTQSIERFYGSFEAHPELGVVYNNYLSTLHVDDMNSPYYLRPGARPWASVAPTLVFHGDRPVLAMGSPGSERIVSSMVQVMLHLEREDPLAAVAAPRLHPELDGRVAMERERFSAQVVDHLEARGHTVDDKGPWAFYFGSVQFVQSDGLRLRAVADCRRDGAARGVGVDRHAQEER